MSTLDQDQTQSPEQLSNNAIEYIRTTAPWMKLVGIFGIIFSSLYTLVGIAMIFISTAAAGAVILVVGLLYVLFTLQIYQSGSSFADYAREKNILMLERGLKKQRLFWIISGSLIIFAILLVILVIIIGGMNSLNILQQMQPRAGS